MVYYFSKSNHSKLFLFHIKNQPASLSFFI
jgi:hypothetical protein